MSKYDEKAREIILPLVNNDPENTNAEMDGYSPHELIEKISAALQAAAEEARAEEREACAKIAAAHVICDWSGLSEKAVDERFGKQIAAAIRERG